MAKNKAKNNLFSNSTLGKSFATQLIDGVKKLVSEFNAKMKANNYVYIPYNVDRIFSPSSEDFKQYETGEEYFSSFTNVYKNKIDVDDLDTIIWDGVSTTSKCLVSKFDILEFKKTGYAQFRERWLEEKNKAEADAKKREEKKDEIKLLKKKIAKLEARLSEFYS